jgi:hypothetical protein
VLTTKHKREERDVRNRVIGAALACTLVPLAWLGTGPGAEANHVTTPTVGDVTMGNLNAAER